MKDGWIEDVYTTIDQNRQLKIFNVPIEMPYLKDYIIDEKQLLLLHQHLHEPLACRLRKCRFTNGSSFSDGHK